jgi:hypothetical protein
LFNALDIALSLNALAKLGHYDNTVFSVLCKQALASGRRFQPTDIANTLNALAKCGHYHEALFRWVCMRV